MADDRERNDRELEHPAADLKTPAGVMSDSDDITPMSARRKEMLERMAREGDAGPMTPEEAAGPGGANRAAYEEDVELRESVENNNGYP